MPSAEPNDGGPHNSPSADPDVPTIADLKEPNRQLLQKFRFQMQTLGGVWMLVGSSMLWVALDALSDPHPKIATHSKLMLLIIAQGLIGVLWLILGLVTCRKRIGAVYVELILCYLLLTGVLVMFLSNETLFTLGFILTTLLFFVFLRTHHRLISLAKKLHDAGIDHTAKA